ncbi:MAG: DUF4419 domain-containing protein [Spirulina sp. SIO3F2]|nr:DUF4419 domain-containing protein [Spirulina sp. SIO3F2]
MSAIAPILNKTANSICFQVDDVEAVTTQLKFKSAKASLEAYLEAPLLAFSHDDDFQVVEYCSTHPLVYAVHRAFSEHRPLVLTPDIIWLTIAQGFAQHVNNNAERLRSRFVAHQGKQELVVNAPLPQTVEDWRSAVQGWALLIRDHVGADVYRLLECNFSTTTPVTQTASHVVMMDAFKKYFAYVLAGICGIPYITLMGTVADWQSIYNRVEQMAQYDLDWWTDRLLPIFQGFVDTASGQPSREFWQHIYKPEEMYGGDLITGWLADLFPYIQHSVTEDVSVRNPIFDVPRSKLIVENGISSRSLPNEISQSPITVEFNGHKISLGLVSGFVGVQQTEDSYLKPEVGWAVRELDRGFVELLDEIQQEHITKPPMDWNNRQPGRGEIPKEYMQVLEKFNGAVLFPSSQYSWEVKAYKGLPKHEEIQTELDRISNPVDRRAHYQKILSDNEEQLYSLPDLRNGDTEPLIKVRSDYAEHFIKLSDRRCIAYYWTRDHCWMLLGRVVRGSNVRGGFANSEDLQLWNPVIIADGISQLFERIFAADGRYFFDDPGFEPISLKNVILR